MIVLGRRTGQSVELTVPHPDGDVVITVKIVGRSGSSTGVGIEAPRSVKVLRTELHARPQSPDTPFPPPQ